jgi:hypothetical protein
MRLAMYNWMIWLVRACQHAQLIQLTTISDRRFQIAAVQLTNQTILACGPNSDCMWIELGMHMAKMSILLHFS